MSITLFNATPASEKTEYIGNIMTVYAREEMEARLCVLNYEVDLYLPRRNLAIECDATKRDAGRQVKIESALGCHFVRFNPGSRDFDFLRVLGRIRRMTDE